MKSISKRVLCILTSLMMLLPLMCVGVSAEVPTTYVFDANDITVNSTHTEILGLPSYISARPDRGNASAKPKAYKQTGILGFTGNESVLELIAREERANNGNFYINDLSFEADSDFYVTTKVYIKDAREMDALRLYATISDSDSKESSASFFLYNGHSYKNLTTLHNQEGLDYVNDNWYNFTMALTKNADDSTKFDVKYYLDNVNLLDINSTTDKSISGSTFVGSDLTIEKFGIGFGYVSGTTDFGGIPQWCAIKDMKIVKATFDPSKFNTKITSGVYTVAATSVAGSGVGTSVTGVPANTSVSTFLGNIAAVDTGATKQVVKIAEDNLATTVMGNDAIVTSDMKLLVTSTNGAMKLYDIDAAVDASLLPSVSSNANYPAYVVGQNTISIPDTTVAKLKDRITLGDGTTVKVVDANGFAVNDNKAVTDTMKLVATKNNYDVEYALEITKNDWLQSMTMGEHESLTSNADKENYFLYKYAWDATADTPGFKVSSDYTATNPQRIRPFNGSGANTELRHFDTTGTAVEMTESSVYALAPAKMPTSQAYAYKASSTNYAGWGSHLSERLMQQIRDDVTDKTLDQTVISFKLYLEDGAAANFAPFHDSMQVSTSGSGNYVQLGDALMFKDNKISLVSGALTGTALPTVNTEIGTYQNNTEYDIKIVETTPDAVNGSDGITLEAIYVNDVKIYPTGNESVTLSSNTKAYGFHAFKWESHGTVYWGDIQIYMTDNYALPEAAAAEADLTIRPNVDAVSIEGDRIYGWESIRTVADLKAAIDSAATTEVEVLNIIGSAALAENVALENGMLFRVTDKNHPENTAYYVLAKTTTDSGTIVTVNGDKVTATRQVLVYTAESSPKSMTIILAVYEGDTLVTAKLDTKTIQAIGDYDFEVEIEGYDEATMTYKAFAWNLGTLVPYEGITD